MCTHVLCCLQSGAGPKECPMLQPTSEASPQESSPQGSTSGAGCDCELSHTDSAGCNEIHYMHLMRLRP